MDGLQPCQRRSQCQHDFGVKKGHNDASDRDDEETSYVDSEPLEISSETKIGGIMLRAAHITEGRRSSAEQSGADSVPAGRSKGTASEAEQQCGAFGTMLRMAFMSALALHG